MVLKEALDINYFNLGNLKFLIISKDVTDITSNIGAP